jgi:O-antigen ligase
MTPVSPTCTGGAYTLRRWVLLLTILISGGNLLLPRAPILLLMMALMAWGAALQVRRKSTGRFAPVILVLAAVLALTVLRPGPLHVESTIVRFANFIAALLLLHLYLAAGLDGLARDLSVVLRPMAWQAVLTVLLAHSLGVLFIPITVGETTYHSLLLIFNYHVSIEDPAALIRPDGFFYEPGIFQIYLNIYLYLVVFIFRSRRQALLAVLAVLATQSTTGVLICMLLLGTALARHLRFAPFKQKLTAALLAAVVAGPIAQIAYTNITNKLSGELQGSSWAREYDFFTGLNVIAENPLLGIGFDYEQYYQASARLAYAETLLEDRLTEERGNTNGIIFLIYSIGIPLALPFLWGLFRQRFLPDRWLVGVCLFLSLLGESVVFTPFFLLIVFSGLLGRVNAVRRRPRALAPSVS